MTATFSRSQVVKSFQAIFSRSLGMLRKVPFVTFVAWIIAAPCRRGLGFYYADDWVDLVAASHGHFDYHGTFQYYLGDFSPRLFGMLFEIFFVRIFGDAPAYWQVGLAVVSGVSSYLLYRFLRLLARSTNDYCLTADLSSALFVLMPTDPGATYWAAFLSPLMCQPFFFAFASGAAKFVSDNPTDSRKYLYVSSLMLMVSFLCYEAYYFQWLLIGALIVLFRWNTLDRRRLLEASVLAAAVQMICIAYNRMATYWIPGAATKAFFRDWGSIFNISSIVSLFSFHLPNALSPWTFEVSAALCGLVALALFGRCLDGSKPPLKAVFFQIVLPLAAIFFGFLLCVLMYAFTGYGVTFMGIESRVALVPTFLLVMAVFVLVNGSQIDRKYLCMCGFLASAIVVTLSGISMELNACHLKAFRRSAKIQMHVISLFGSLRHMLGPMRPDTRIIYVGPYYIGTVPVFQADDSLSIAIRERFAEFREVPYSRNFISIFTGHILTWDGKTVLQGQSANFNWKNESTEVWVFDYYKKSLRRMREGEMLDPSEFGAFVRAPGCNRIATPCFPF